MSKTFKLAIYIASAVALALSFSDDVLAKTKAKLTVLHSFAGGADGATPYSTLVMDGKGNLYGTTLAGGSANLGTVFRINKKGVETVLHTFTGGSDGANPYAGLIFGADGALYGTTYHGGSSGLGTVYKITTSGSETVLHAFQGIFNNHDGSFPYGGLVFASDGNMYGTTVNGGSQNDNGIIYGLEPNGAVTELYEFGDALSDGNHPYSNLTEGVCIIGPCLMGTTLLGSNGDGTDRGTAFTFVPPFLENGTAEFFSVSDGEYPMAGVAFTGDSNDSVLTTASRGGNYGLGTIVLAGTSGSTGEFQSLYSFGGINASDGSFPNSSLFHASSGYYYGTTLKGGNSSDSGTIYSFQYNQFAASIESAIYRFSGPDGSLPYGSVIEGKPGTFYGTTSSGGANNLGVVYKLVVK